MTEEREVEDSGMDLETGTPAKGGRSETVLDAGIPAKEWRSGADEKADWLQQICGAFSVSPANIKTYSSLALAYIGDGIFDVIIRTIYVCKANAPAASLHRKTSRIVNAHTQTLMYEALKADFTEEEKAVFRRGRNAKPHTIAKNATMHDYRMATGFEAVLGHLYLEGRMDRIISLVKMGLERVQIQEEPD